MSSTYPADNDQQPLSTQGSASEKEYQLGGTTNLSLDQLKKEGDNNSPGEDGPDGQYGMQAAAPGEPDTDGAGQENDDGVNATTGA